MTTDAQFPFALFEAIDGRRWDALGAMLAADIVYERPGYPELRGRDAVLRFYRQERIIARGRHVITDIASQDSRVSCHGHFSGHSTSDVPLHVAFCDFYILRERTLAYRKTFFYVPAI